MDTTARSADPPPLELTADAVLGGRFRLIRRIARGGVGVVWLARDERLGRSVALKILVTDRSVDDADRFHAEALAAAQVDHHNVVRLYDVSVSGPMTVLVMEYVEGPDLRAVLGAPLPPPAVAAIGIQVADALAAAHHHRIVHRDVKPENVLVAKDGLVKLTDFGVAKLLRGSEASLLSGAVVGSPAYVAPEQLDGGSIDGRTDLYALGVLLWECATGTRPFSGDTAAAILYSRVVRDLPDLREVVAGVPPELAAAVRRATRRAPRDRYQDAAQFAAALRHLAVRPQSELAALWRPNGQAIATPSAVPTP